MGDPGAAVTRVLVALDPSPYAAAQAAAMGAELLLTHHPVIFSGLKRLPAEDPVYLLARAGVAAIAAHTNLDAAQGGVNDALAGALGLTDVQTAPDGISRIGHLPAALLPAAFAALAISRLGAPAVQWRAGERPVETVALCSGAGAAFMHSLLDQADAFLTGELKYHDWPPHGGDSGGRRPFPHRNRDCRSARPAAGGGFSLPAGGDGEGKLSLQRAGAAEIGRKQGKNTRAGTPAVPASPSSRASPSEPGKDRDCYGAGRRVSALPAGGVDRLSARRAGGQGASAFPGGTDYILAYKGGSGASTGVRKLYLSARANSPLGAFLPISRWKIPRPRPCSVCCCASG